MVEDQTAHLLQGTILFLPYCPPEAPRGALGQHQETMQ